MDDLTAIFTAVLGLFRHKFTLYGFTISYWDVLVWCLIAGIIISFIKGLLIGLINLQLSCAPVCCALRRWRRESMQRNTKMYLLTRPLRWLRRRLRKKLRRLLRRMLRVYLLSSMPRHWPKL